MAKKETKETYKDVKSDQAASEARFNTARTAADKSVSDAETARLGSRSSLLGSADNIRSGAGNWQGFVDTGGYSPERTKSIEENVGGLKELGRTGGIDPESMARFRGLGGYDEFAATGGYTNKDKSNLRSRALAPISSMASATTDELARRRNVQGGYAPAFDASSRALRRDTGRLLSDTSRDAELDIQDRVNAGRQWGISGVSQSENALQGLRTGNMYKGLTGAADVEMQLQNSINQFKAMGMSAQDAANAAIAQIMGSVYSSDVGQEEGARNRSASLLGEQTNADLGYYGARNPIATQPGVGGNILRGIGAGAGIASQFVPGGGFTGGRNMDWTFAGA